MRNKWNERQNELRMKSRRTRESGVKTTCAVTRSLTESVRFCSWPSAGFDCKPNCSSHSNFERNELRPVFGVDCCRDKNVEKSPEALPIELDQFESGSRSQKSRFRRKSEHQTSLQTNVGTNIFTLWIR